MVLVDDKKTIDYVELEEDEDWITPEPFTPTPEPYIEDFTQEGNYRLYDILWSDGRASQHIRPVSDGAIPIGLCVIPTNWLDEGEKARFIALKYMSSETPTSGSSAAEKLVWGEIYSDATPNPEIELSTIIDEYSINKLAEPLEDPIEEYWVPYVCKSEKDGTDQYYLYYDWRGAKDFKDLRDRDNWLYTSNYCKENPGRYAIGDINGKQNTINISVEGNYVKNETYADMKTCVAQYAPTSTQSGDWYIPALGELVQFVFRLTSDQNEFSINDRLAKISKMYPKNCMTEFNDRSIYWASTVRSGISAFSSYVDYMTLSLAPNNRDYLGLVVAFLQR